MVLLLAAGRAARFGRDKRRELLCKGLTLLELSIDCYRQTGLRVVTCLSADTSDDDPDPRHRRPPPCGDEPRGGLGGVLPPLSVVANRCGRRDPGLPPSTTTTGGG